MLKYLHENGCPWDEGTCVAAAKGGHLDVLKYAHKNGCPCDLQRCLQVASSDEVKAWIAATQLSSIVI